MARRTPLAAIAALAASCAVAPAPPSIPMSGTPGPGAAVPSLPPATSASATPRAATTPPPAPSSAQAPPVTGAWAYGEGIPERPAGGIQACEARQVLHLHQEGDVVRLERRAEHPLCGPPNERLTGRLDGAALTIVGTHFSGFETWGVRYELAYDPATRHWTGTRNGTPIWLVPVEGGCASVPVGCSAHLRGRVFHRDGRPATGDGYTLELRSYTPLPIAGGTFTIPEFAMDMGPLAIQVKRNGVVLAERQHPYGNYLLNFGGPATEADPEAPAYAIP